ncbi:hypothetical protein [Bifidobacterium avesanii]|uniref:Uncharacterized protein n=2 Tax=Bifidobacterium avesanii TaxID=1798157 RepID=A0A7K3TJG2_9BIFI|nr:hypothetical protein [Bifidobacterium avesanii]NEG79172.1 hypothetical protein [Bifidobacterium avesanii]
MAGLFAYLIITGALTAWNAVPEDVGDGSFALFSAGTVPVWWRATMLFAGAGLAAANLIVGALRTGTPVTPATSVLAFWLVVLGVQTFRGLHGLTLSDKFANAAVTALWFAAAAFLPYAIGRYGLRRLNTDRNPATRTGRLLIRLRRNPTPTGCWIALAGLYGLLVWTRCTDPYGWATVLYLVFVNTVALAVIMAVAASASAKSWRLIVVALVAQVTVTMSLTNPLHVGGCPDYYVGNDCVTLPNGWGLIWNDLGMIVAYSGIPLAFALAGWGMGTVIRAAGERRRAARGVRGDAQGVERV